MNIKRLQTLGWGLLGVALAVLAPRPAVAEPFCVILNYNQCSPFVATPDTCNYTFTVKDGATTEATVTYCAAPGVNQGYHSTDTGFTTGGCACFCGFHFSDKFIVCQATPFTLDFDVSGTGATMCVLSSCPVCATVVSPQSFSFPVCSASVPTGSGASINFTQGADPGFGLITLSGSILTPELHAGAAAAPAALAVGALLLLADRRKTKKPHAAG